MKRSGITSFVRHLRSSVYPSYFRNRIARLLLKTGFARKLKTVKNNLEKQSYHTWVSPRHKYLYVGIPKVACTKVKAVLQEYEGYPVPERFAELHHRLDQSQRYVPRLTDLSDDECREALNSPEWFRFSFVRNPYYRLFSAYKSKILFLDPDSYDQYVDLRDKIRQTYGYPIRSGKPAGVVAFKDFVHYVCEAPENRLDGHWALQTEMLMLDLINYDFIGRFENFQCDFSQVLDRLGARAELQERANKWVNKTVQIHPAAAFDRETASWVYEVYRDDFVNFGYDRHSWMFDDEA